MPLVAPAAGYTAIGQLGAHTARVLSQRRAPALSRRHLSLARAMAPADRRMGPLNDAWTGVFKRKELEKRSLLTEDFVAAAGDDQHRSEFRDYAMALLRPGAAETMCVMGVFLIVLQLDPDQCVRGQGAGTVDLI
jgi:hypothetical protein